VTDPADKRLGTEFEGRYEILSLLGEGGMGAVYEARHKFTGKHVALKIFHAWVTRTPGARERFLREAQAPNAIGHPAIAEVIDAGIAADETPYLVLELLRGDSLNQALAKGPIAVHELTRITIEVLGALAAAHERGLVHRDIKPENVFLCEGEPRRVKVLDFGILRQVGGDAKLTSTGQILGTPHYMSPEQARGSEVDARSDLWSVGAMLFDALAGRPPYEAANYNLIIVAILTEDPPRLRERRPDVPQEIEAIVERALQKDVGKRWQSAREMMQALASAGGVSFGGATAQLATPTTASSRVAERTPDAPVTPMPMSSPSAPITAPAVTPAFTPAPATSPIGLAQGPAGIATPPPAHAPTTLLPVMSEPSMPAAFGAPSAPGYAVPSGPGYTAPPRPPPAKSSGLGFVIAGAVLILLVLVVGGTVFALVAFRRTPGSADAPRADPQPIEEPELPIEEPIEEPMDPTETEVLEELLGDPNADGLDPDLQNTAIEEAIRRALEEREREDETEMEERGMRLTREERIERRQAAMCVARCMTRSQRACRRPGMEAECQATYLSCLSGCGEAENE
jgi:serine/threonine protein kinase